MYLLPFLLLNYHSVSSSRLPQELVDTIIDELKNNGASLRVCSLISKLWVYRSRKYLHQQNRPIAVALCAP